MLKIGKLVGEPLAIPDGFSHKIYAVRTTQGKYAIKALNPQCMLQPSAIQKIITSEQIANIASKRILAITAMKFNNKSVQELDHQLYLVFNWTPGRNLDLNEITIEHNEKMGAILADIHMTDFSDVDIHSEYLTYKPQIDWKFYLQQGKNCKAVWVDLLEESIDVLYNYYLQAVEAGKSLESITVISHRNLDSRNVMWCNYNPTIVDWEDAGLVNPFYDFVNTAIHWSKNETGDIDKDKFFAFAHSYKKKHGAINANWRTILYKRLIEPLDWLEYSLKRSLKIDCADEEEQQVGTDHVFYMIEKEIIPYADKIDILENLLNEI